MYVAAVQFVDLQDGYRYAAGEKFPREGLYVSNERIAELAGSNNRMGYPLIKQVVKAVESPLNGVSSADNKIPAQAPKAPKKPRRKRESNA